MGDVPAGSKPPKNVEMCPQCFSSLLYYREDAELPRYSRASTEDARKQWCYRCGDKYQKPGISYVRVDAAEEVLLMIARGLATVEQAMKLLRYETKTT